MGSIVEVKVYQSVSEVHSLVTCIKVEKGYLVNNIPLQNTYSQESNSSCIHADYVVINSGCYYVYKFWCVFAHGQVFGQSYFLLMYIPIVY